MKQIPGNQVGDWKCIKVLGKGSFGIVALWKNLQDGSQAAIKQFEVRNVHNDRVLAELRERWKNEVEIMYNLVDCSHIVSTLQLPICFQMTFEHLQMPLLCMEFCEGGDLRQLLKRPENIAGLPEKDVRSFLEQIGQAISYLHNKNIVHRDIKCENIIIDNKNQTCFKIADLGFAKDLSDSQSLCSTVVGTLQYLAPEIYMGKRYDKTVDYWSFGLIAFEVACGMRPFLHGESPSQWIPYVEEKEVEVICIYRTEDGNVEFSKKIPYSTHLTEMFKQFLECWLKIMLQLDATKRGCKISSSGTPLEFTNQNTYGLSSLPIMLRHKRLEIYSPMKKLGFVIGKSTTIDDLQQIISRQLNLTIENQLIFTSDGSLVKKNELASKFTDVVDLYLIPKIIGWYRLKIKLPRIVHNFLQDNIKFKDPTSLRRIWGETIYFMQSELEKFDILRKMSNALRIWVVEAVIPEFKDLCANTEKLLCSAKNLMELEKRLAEIDNSFTDDRVPSESKESIYSVNDVANLEKYYTGFIHDVPCNLKDSHVRTCDMEEIYHKTLKYYEEWRNTERNSGIMEHLLRGLCQFVAQRDTIIESLSKKIALQLDHVEAYENVLRKLKNVSSKLEKIMHDVMKIRCEKQKALLAIVFGNPKGLQLESTSDMPSKPKEHIYAVPNKMSKSDAMPTGQLSRTSFIPPILNSTISLDGTKRESKFSVTDIMQDSQILQFETEEILTKCSEKLNRLLKESDDLDWEFL